MLSGFALLPAFASLAGLSKLSVHTWQRQAVTKSLNSLFVLPFCPRVVRKKGIGWFGVLFAFCAPGPCDFVFPAPASTAYRSVSIHRSFAPTPRSVRTLDLWSAHFPQARRGEDRPGEPRPGQARRAEATRGEARRGQARRGEGRPGEARPAMQPGRQPGWQAAHRRAGQTARLAGSQGATGPAGKSGVGRTF